MNNFDIIYDRKNTGCIKWSRNPYNHPNPIPMGIADMDFAVPDFVLDGIKQRMEHPILGYFRPGNDFYEAIIKWQRGKFGVLNLTQEQIVYQHSVLGGVATALEILSKPKDAVILQTPAYANFGNLLKEHDRKVVTNPLVWNGNGYDIDFVDFEKKIINHNVKVFLFCSPHNPTGRVWSGEEINSLVEICCRHNVKIISDEVWSDIILNGEHIPTHSVSEKAADITISLYSPTKTFNIAGLVISYGVIFNQELVDAYKKFSDKSHYNHCNLLSMSALISSYQQGEQWCQQLCDYLKTNMQTVHTFMADNFPKVRVPNVEGTYLMWLDFSDTELSSDQLMEICGKVGLYFNDGRSCVENGDKCLRMNTAMPYTQLTEALNRMKKLFAPYLS